MAVNQKQLIFSMIDNVVTLDAGREWHQGVTYLLRTGQLKELPPLSQPVVAAVADDIVIGKFQQHWVEELQRHFMIVYFCDRVNGITMDTMINRLQAAVEMASREKKPITVYAIKLLKRLINTEHYPQLQGTLDKAMNTVEGT
jgi:hypothetical protein